MPFTQPTWTAFVVGATGDGEVSAVEIIIRQENEQSSNFILISWNRYSYKQENQNFSHACFFLN